VGSTAAELQYYQARFLAGRATGTYTLGGLSRKFGFALALGLCLVFTGAPRAHAETPGVLSEQEAAEVELALKAQTILFEMERSLQQRLEQDPTVPDLGLEEVLKSTGTKILDLYTKPAPKAFRERARDLLYKLSWRGIRDKVIDLGKRHGIPGAAAIVMSNVFDVVLSAILIKVGLPWAAPIAFSIPWEPVFFGVSHRIQTAILDERLAKLYGDRDAYFRDKAVRQEARKELGLRHVRDLLVPVLKSESVIVSKTPGFLGKMLEKIGLGSGGLTWTELRSFVASHQEPRLRVDPKIMDALNADKELSDEAKAAILLNHLASLPDQYLLNELRQKYEPAFIFVQHDSGDGARWAAKFAAVKTLDEVRALMEQIPKGLSPRAVGRIWYEVLLPYLIGHLEGVDKTELKRWQRDFVRVLAEAEHSDDTEWTAQWQDKIASYLKAPEPAAEVPAKGCPYRAVKASVLRSLTFR